MNALLYLIGAVVVASAAIGALTYRQRRPKSMEAGIREFERGLRALDPTLDPRRRGGLGNGDHSGRVIPGVGDAADEPPEGGREARRPG